MNPLMAELISNILSILIWPIGIIGFVVIIGGGILQVRTAKNHMEMMRQLLRHKEQTNGQ